MAITKLLKNKMLFGFLIQELKVGRFLILIILSLLKIKFILNKNILKDYLMIKNLHCIN